MQWISRSTRSEIIKTSKNRCLVWHAKRNRTTRWGEVRMGGSGGRLEIWNVCEHMWCDGAVGDGNVMLLGTGVWHCHDRIVTDTDGWVGWLGAMRGVYSSGWVRNWIWYKVEVGRRQLKIRARLYWTDWRYWRSVKKGGDAQNMYNYDTVLFICEFAKLKICNVQHRERECVCVCLKRGKMWNN